MNRRLLIVLALIVAGGVAYFLVDRTDEPTSGQTVPTVVVLNIQDLPFLKSVEDGAVEALGRAGYSSPQTARVLYRRVTVQDLNLATQLALWAKSQRPDVIIAISTPIAQAVARNVKAPLVFGALTDPVSAGIVTDLQRVPPEITGTTDAIPYQEQLALVRRVLPSARRLGLIFNPGEPSSRFALSELAREAPRSGFELVEGAVSSTNDVYNVAQSLASRSDVLLISTDNTVAAGIAGAVKVAIERQIPLFACDSGSVAKGAIGAVSPGYSQIGQATGELAARFLKGERSIPVVVPKTGGIYLNREAARRMGVALSEELLTEATQVEEKVAG